MPRASAPFHVAARALPALAAALLALAAPRPLAAQGEPRYQAELRADAIAARATAYQAGLGVNARLTNYVRLGALVAAGMTLPPGSGGAEPSARADLVGRFLLDPFRERRWGAYAGAGLSTRVEHVRRDADSGAGSEFPVRGYLLLAFGVEGPEFGNRLLPALEVGFGGGTRVGVVLRRARPGRR